MSDTDFITTYQTYYRRALLYTQSYVHDISVAEDIVSESLIKLWQAMKSQSVDNPKVYLFAIVRNQALDYLKHQSIVQKAFDEISLIQKRELEIRIASLEKSQLDNLYLTEIQAIANKTLSGLNERSRYIFELSRNRNMSNSAIAEKLGITVKGVEYHMSTVLKALKKSLKDYLSYIIFVFFLQ